MNRFKPWLNTVWACVIVLFLSSCQLTGGNIHQISCGQSSYGKWYDYYWSALACMDEQQYEMARSEFQRALDIREKDERRAYIGGMHWITDYFPNRELGITYYLLKQYPEAEKQLQRSLAQFPSSKAQWYLNRTRQKLPEIITKEKAPPVIKHKRVSLPDKDVLELQISDDSFVEYLVINGRLWPWQDIVKVKDTQISIQRAKRSLTIRYPIQSLLQNKLLISAFDIFDKERRLDLSYYLDNSVPSLKVNSVTPDSQIGWMLNATAQDLDSPIKSITVNEKSIAVEHTFSHRVTGDTAKITITDLNDNVLTRELFLPDMQAISLDLNPNIPAATQATSIYINGSIFSNKPLDYLSINGQTMTVNPTTGEFGRTFTISKRFNVFTIEAKNRFETISKQFSVTRFESSPLPPEERLRIALFPFICDMDKQNWCDTQYISEPGEQPQSKQSLLSMMSNSPRFNMVNLVDLKPHIEKVKKCNAAVIENCIMEELTLTQQNTALIGRVIQRNGVETKGVEAYAFMIDPTSGQLLIGFDAYKEANIHPSINEQLYSRIHEKFPIVTSNALTIEGNKVTATFDQHHLLWPNMPVKRFSGKKACGQGKIEQLSTTSAKATINEHCRYKASQPQSLVTM